MMLARSSGKVVMLPPNADSISVHFANCCLLPLTLTLQEHSECALNGSMGVEAKQSSVFSSSTVCFGMLPFP